MTRKKVDAGNGYVALDDADRRRIHEQRYGFMSPDSLFDAPFTEDEIEFLKAVDRWRTRYRKAFVPVHVYLSILVSLGYRKEPPCSTSS